ncbi:hypothetical protein J6X04_03530, partial [Candidatus Saccharibacteria bacterium]|nr:hypothetical protein [Candidatus Saccharibacteria bacterium]
MKKFFLPTSIKAFLLTVAVLFFNTTLTYGQTDCFRVDKDGSTTFYSTFVAALVYINQNGDEDTKLTLLNNYTVDNNVEYDLIIQKPITFNLNGYVLNLNNGTLYTEVDNSVTITNKDEDGGSLFNIRPSDGGTIKSSNYTVLVPYGPLTLKKVTVETTFDLPNYQQGCNVKLYVIVNSDNLILEEGTQIKGCCDDSQTNVEFPTTRYIKPVMSVDKLKLGHACDLYKIEQGKLINVCDAFGYNFDDLGPLYQVMKAQNFKAEYNGRSQTFGCLEDAIDENNYPAGSDVTITLLKDYIRKEDYFNKDRYKDDNQTVNEIISKINFTFDFSKYSITDTFAITVKNGKKLTIKAGESDNYYAFINLEGGAKLDLEGGNWNFYTEFLKINSGCTATIEPNSVTTGVKSSSDWSINTHSPEYIPFVENNGGTLTIDGGTFDYSNVEGSDATILYGIYAKSGVTTIKGGIFGQQNKPGYAMKIDDGSTVTISGGEFYGKNGSGSNPAIDYKGENALLDQTKKLMFCGDGNSPIIFTDDNGDCVLEKWKKKASEWTLQDDPVLIVTEYRNEDKTINDYILSQILLEREYDGGIYVNSKSNGKMYTGGSPLGLAVSLQAIAYQDPKNSNDEDAASDVGNNKNIVATPDAWAFWYDSKLYLWSAKKVKISDQGSITPRVVNPQLTDENFEVRKEYDGTTDIPKELLELLNDVGFSFSEEDELAMNEDVNFVFTGASFVTPDVDVAKEVAYSFKLDGENARHFKLPEDDNTMILYNGRITPRPLTDEEKSAIESKIKDCVVRQKYEDDNSECKLKANSFVYEISDILKVTVTIEKAQYINQEGRPIREIGGPYDIVVT